MFEWVRNRLRGAGEMPLSGAPPVRRQKTYSAQSGYVYQYLYEGMRETARLGEPATEFVFGVSADRKASFPVPVLVLAISVSEWQAAHSRELTATEVYAIAKMALFQAFDEREHPGRMRQDVLVRPADLGAILQTLGIE